MRELSRSEVRVEAQAPGLVFPNIEWYRWGEYAALFLFVSALWGVILWMALGGLH